MRHKKPYQTEGKLFFCSIIVLIFILFVCIKESSAHNINSLVRSDLFTEFKQINQTILIIGNYPIVLTGTVIDASTSKPISNAMIQIVSPVYTGSSYVYKTDEEGNYSIPITDSTEKRTISLFIAAADYQETTIKISFEDYGTQNNVLLSPSTNDVVIISHNKPKKKIDITEGKDTVIDSNKLKPKKHFNFFNLFRKTKNWK